MQGTARLQVGRHPRGYACRIVSILRGHADAVRASYCCYPRCVTKKTAPKPSDACNSSRNRGA
jgi:hypothetical protein